MVPWVPGGCGGARLTAGPRVRGLGAEGVGADRGDGPPHQPAPRGDVDVHLRGPQEGLPWGRGGEGGYDGLKPWSRTAGTREIEAFFYL